MLRLNLRNSVNRFTLVTFLYVVGVGNTLTRVQFVLGKPASRRQGGSSDGDPALGTRSDVPASRAPAGETRDADDCARVEGAAPEARAQDLQVEDW